ncbi:hypothetical protein [Erysipelothrix aquatica]|uniref:hypothetical protein n=1 Tax=Erysipelothrix aquatica TaxID=2683714 RepID=UPI00135C806D|nr:hypothetical protein [Erysipelothrix aquatica]
MSNDEQFKSSEAQRRASREWMKRNKDKADYSRGLSTGRTFTDNRETINDLNELKEKIEKRIKELEEQN